MPDRPVPEESVEAGRKVFREGGYAREIIETAALAIRKQEREWVLEALETLRQQWLDDSESPKQYKQGKLDALTHLKTTLEDSDG